LSCLHHENDGVKPDHEQNEILEQFRHDERPHLMLERLVILRHVAVDRTSVDHEFDALLLERERKTPNNDILTSAR